MKEPDHKVKRHFVPFSNKEKPHWVSYPVHGWLGSGVKDKNDREIFEGDILLCFSFGGTPHKLPVAFRDGCFCYKDIDGKYYPLEPNNVKYLEVVGHLSEEQSC